MRTEVPVKRNFCYLVVSVNINLTVKSSWIEEKSAFFLWQTFIILYGTVYVSIWALLHSVKVKIIVVHILLLIAFTKNIKFFLYIA